MGNIIRDPPIRKGAEGLPKLFINSIIQTESPYVGRDCKYKWHMTLHGTKEYDRLKAVYITFRFLKVKEGFFIQDFGPKDTKEYQGTVGAAIGGGPIPATISANKPLSKIKIDTDKQEDYIRWRFNDVKLDNENKQSLEGFFVIKFESPVQLLLSLEVAPAFFKRGIIKENPCTYQPNYDGDITYLTPEEPEGGGQRSGLGGGGVDTKATVEPSPEQLADKREQTDDYVKVPAEKWEHFKKWEKMQSEGEIRPI